MSIFVNTIDGEKKHSKYIVEAYVLKDKEVAEDIEFIITDNRIDLDRGSKGHDDMQEEVREVLWSDLGPYFKKVEKESNVHAHNLLDITTEYVMAKIRRDEE